MAKSVCFLQSGRGMQGGMEDPPPENDLVTLGPYMKLLLAFGSNSRVLFHFRDPRFSWVTGNRVLESYFLFSSRLVFASGL